MQKSKDEAATGASMPNRDGFIPDPRPEKFPSVSKTPHQQLLIAPVPAK